MTPYFENTFFSARSHCEGDTKATNSLRKLMTSLSSGNVPSSWRAEYPSPTDTGISSWVADLVSRTEALDRYRPMFRTKEAVSGTRYWMGGMFNPHSFITATRQHSAQVFSVTSLIHLFDLYQFCINHSILSTLFIYFHFTFFSHTSFLFSIHHALFSIP